MHLKAAFVRALSFVMERDGEWIGLNRFMTTVIKADDGRAVNVFMKRKGISQ